MHGEKIHMYVYVYKRVLYSIVICKVKFDVKMNYIFCLYEGIFRSKNYSSLYKVIHSDGIK